MHSFYLRSLYIHNELARGELELAGQQLCLDDVRNDAYVVGAINGHIVPWPASYRATNLLSGDVRYVLSSGGHVAGISTRLGRSGGTRQPRATRLTQPAGRPWPRGRLGPGGRTGPGGHRPTPATSSGRQVWAAARTRPTLTHPATTSSAEADPEEALDENSVRPER